MIALISAFYLKDSNPLSAIQVKSEKNEPAAGTPPRVVDLPKLPGKLSKDLSDLINSEARAMGSPDPNPDATGKRLQQRADALTADEASQLRSLSLDAQYDQDQRFLAAFLLAHCHNPAVIPELQSLVLAPYVANPEPESPASHFDFMLRAQAIEGFSNFGGDSAGIEASKAALQKIISSSDKADLNDRAARVLAYLQNPTSVPALVDQDKQGLRKLLDIPKSK